MSCKRGTDAHTGEPDCPTCEIERLRDDIERLHEKDRQKTREINVLVPENRNLRSECGVLTAEVEHYKALAERWRTTAVNVTLAQPEPLVVPSLEGIPKKMSELDVLNAEIHARTWHENGPCRECLVYLHKFLLEKRWYEQKRMYRFNNPRP